MDKEERCVISAWEICQILKTIMFVHQADVTSHFFCQTHIVGDVTVYQMLVEEMTV